VRLIQPLMVDVTGLSLDQVKVLSGGEVYGFKRVNGRVLAVVGTVEYDFDVEFVR